MQEISSPAWVAALPAAPYMMKQILQAVRTDCIVVIDTREKRT